jgi:uncharacterized membrane protein
MSSDQVLMIVLRLLHIGAGVFWVGSVFFLNLFALPAIQAAGPDGPRFMGLLMREGRVQRSLIHAGIVTIVSGFIIYGRFTMETQGLWARSTAAMGYGVGAIAAIVAFAIGIAVNAPSARRLQAIGATPGGPSAEQQAEAARIRARLAAASRLTLWMLVVAVISMAISRYL